MDGILVEEIDFCCGVAGKYMGNSSTRTIMLTLKLKGKRKTIDVPMDWLDDGEEMYKLFMEGKVPTDDDEEEEEEDEDHEISADVSPPAAAPVTVPEENRRILKACRKRLVVQLDKLTPQDLEKQQKINADLESRTCRKCVRVYATKWGLKKHLGTPAHGGEIRFATCRICLQDQLYNSVRDHEPVCAEDHGKTEELKLLEAQGNAKRARLELHEPSKSTKNPRAKKNPRRNYDPHSHLDYVSEDED